MKNSASSPARHPFAATRRSFLRGLRRFVRALNDFVRLLESPEPLAPALARRLKKLACLLREFVRAYRRFVKLTGRYARLLRPRPVRRGIAPAPCAGSKPATGM